MPNTNDIPAAESAPGLGSVAPTGALIYENYRLRGVEREQVTAIEYHRTKAGLLVPLSVFTTSADEPGGHCSVYDFEWCERDGTLYYHESGGGGRGSFYMSPLAKPQTPPRGAVWWDRDVTYPVDAGKIKGGKLSDKTVRRWGYELLAAPALFGGEANPFDAGQDGETQYCSRCKDFLPWDSPCDHIFICEKCGHFSEPGDRCKHRRSSH